MGSVAYKLMRVAAGYDHLTFSVQHKSEWDICGGVALLNAAGKVYRRFDGESLRFNQKHTLIRSGAVAGDEAIVNQFLAALASQSENWPSGLIPRRDKEPYGPRCGDPGPSTSHGYDGRV